MSENTTNSPETPALGQLTQEEMAQLNALRRAAHDYTFQIGQVEVKKSRLIGLLSETEARAQAVLNAAAKRLQIPEGQAWVVGPNGQVRDQPGA